MSWSARQYLKFEDERTRPVRDLLSVVPSDSVASAIDLGCGPGNSTEVLLQRFPQAKIRGIDSSDDMIDAARRRLPALAFEVADIASWSSTGACDLLLANAVFHWLPDHQRLLPRLVGMLAAGGSLAIQMPDNDDEPSHVLMREIARQPRWKSQLAPALAARVEIQPPAWYYPMLRSHCSRVDIWRTLYHHCLDGTAAILEWFKGSGLRPFLARLDANEQRDFERQYSDGLASAYPLQSDGTVLLAFPRLFIVATP